MKDSYDPGFGAPVAALSSVGFSNGAKMDYNQGCDRIVSQWCSVNKTVTVGQPVGRSTKVDDR